MFGSGGAGVSAHPMPAAQGILPLAVSDLFNTAKSIQDRVHTFSVSVFEVYMNKLCDLLVQGASKVFVSSEGEISGLVEAPVDSARSMMNVIQEGASRRKSRRSQDGHLSSRSHLFVIIHCRSVNPETDERVLTSLTFTDLAGTERLSTTTVQSLIPTASPAEKEACDNNQGLLALHNLLNYCSREHNQEVFSYRSNPLTCLFRNTIGGNVKALMLINISEDTSSLREAQIALQKGRLAREIYNSLTSQEILPVTPSHVPTPRSPQISERILRAMTLKKQLQNNRPCVKVLCRVRNQWDNRSTKVLSVPQPMLLRERKGKNEYEDHMLSHVLDSDAAQEDVYNYVRSTLSASLRGGKASVVTYGPHFSGKTHTMFGGRLADGNFVGPSRGIVPRFVEEFFQGGCAAQGKLLYMSMFHDLKSTLLDLLNEGRTKVQILNTGKAQGCLSVQVDSVDHFQELLEYAWSNLGAHYGGKHVGPIARGASRIASHVFVAFEICQQRRLPPAEGQEEGELRLEVLGEALFADLCSAFSSRKGDLNDLHSPEVVSAANQSLVQFAGLIRQLSHARKAGGLSAMSFRASPLTLLLRDTFGGDSHTCLVLNLSPDSCDISQSNTCLEVARQAVKIQQSYEPTEDEKELAVQALKELRNMGGSSNSLLAMEAAEARSSSGAASSDLLSPF